MTDTSLQFAGIPLVAWVAALPLLGAFINLVFGRWLSRAAVHTIAVGTVAAAFGVAAYLVFGPLLTLFRGHTGEGSVEITRTLWTWIEVGPPDSVFKVDLAFRLDTLSAVMILVVTGVGTLIHLYSTGYMSEEPRYAAYFGYLNLFTGAMLILVLGANMPVMFIGWEGVGLCSFLLIGFWFENESYASAGRKAFVVNRIGDFAFLLGMFLLFWITKSLDFADIREFAAAGSSKLTTDPHFMGFDRWATIICVLLFIGACGKSAQVPLFVWLPDAMAGPTPVSALIHAATMVTAGVYTVCRLSFLFSLSTTAMMIVATVGTITALVAAFMAFAQTDLKKVLAYSTVSQLGFMFVAAGTGHWVAAIFHLGTHAFFKAGLFLGAGSVMHGMNGSGDITRMGGLRKHMPITRITFLIYCLAIAGIFPFAGFFSKDEILGGAFATHLEGWGQYGKVLFVALSVAALGTAFYMWRLYFLVFSGDERSEDAEHAHESPWTMTVPLAVLAVLTTVAGFLAFPHLHDLGNKWLHLLSSWLEPAVNVATEAENGDGTTTLLLAIALGIGATGIGLAYWLYGRGPSKQVEAWTAAEEAPLHGAYLASKNKLWVDEIYEVIFLKPFRFLARFLFEFVDRFVIDTILVGGWAFIVGLLSRLSRWVQNGQVQRYIVGMVLGAAAIFFFVARGHAPTFSFKEVPAGVELRAEPGAGLAGVGATYRWDLDGDGQQDRKPGAKPDDTSDAAFVSDPVLTVKAGDLAASGVTLWITPAGARSAIQVKRAIQFDAPDRPATEGGK
jgi:NADH-quinone oxidoreductase subunit L